MKAGHVLGLLAAAALAGCQTFADAPQRATAGLHPTAGNKAAGEVTFEQLPDGRLRVTAQVIGLAPNQEHGFHIHEVGDCSSGDGMSAKGHFNPYGKPHGPPGAEHHAGDMPSLKADGRGRAQLQAELDVVTLKPGPANIIGRAVIVHARPDDYSTQPTGNSGARIACGVIKAG
jgi:Cu-Zn family superoxide dismutase